MNSLNLDQLQTLSLVAELGSFSAAADRLGITQPAVSLQVRQLERRLGVRLIERTGRRAQPTAAGLELLRHAGQIQQSVAQALEAIAPHRSGTLGRVRIGSGATACTCVLPRVLKRLRAKLPGLEVVVHTGNTLDVLKLVEDNQLDLALVTLPAPGRALQVTPAIEDELVAVFPSNETPPRRITAQFLCTQPLLLYQSGHTRLAVDQWFAAHGCSARPVMQLDSVEAIKRLVGARLGWGVLPRMSVQGAEASKDVRVQSLSPRLSRQLGIVLRRDKHLHRGLQELIRELQAWQPA
jgi:DNA-binding transcriptional LysR family regulator